MIDFNKKLLVLSQSSMTLEGKTKFQKHFLVALESPAIATKLSAIFKLALGDLRSLAIKYLI